MIGIRKLRYYLLTIESLFWKLYIYFKSNILWNIEIGKKCVFNGNTIFYKTRDSKIIIGNNCQFISKTNNFNLIGINRPCIIATHSTKAVIEIGNNSGFSGTVIGAFKSIKIGSNVKCGANTLITDSDWHLDDPRSGEIKEVILEDNVWLGEGTKVLKGVRIGKNSVIGAGSIVTSNIPENVIAAGNPCRIIKNINFQ